MNRIIQYLNLLGVLALVVLCTAQWRVNSQANQQVDHLDKIKQDQAAQLTENSKTLAANATDLSDLRQRLALAESAAREAQGKLDASTTECAKLTAQRDQLKSALDQWIAAVSERDAAIKQAGQQLQKLSADRNDAVEKFNDLTGKYNALVKDVNEERAKQ